MATENNNSESAATPAESAGEAAWLLEVARALRSIRYGSVVLTIHDGRVVELNKTERIRKSPA